MRETIRITMLGAEECGKTCYMLGMYAVMRDGVSGFTFTARDETPDDDLDLELSKAWMNLIKKEDQSRWPKPTTTARRYSFDFRHGFSSMMRFEWLDYRGGAIKEAASLEEKRELKKQLGDSSAIFLCISGEYLQPGYSIAEVREQAAVARMLQRLGELHDETAVIPPVAIVITKFDLCHKMSRDEIERITRELFSPLFQEDSDTVVMICPVSLGIDLARDQFKGVIAPKNVHLPVSFAVYSAIKHNRTLLNEDIRLRNGSIAAYGGNWFKDWWNSSEIAMTEKERAELERKKEQIEKHLRLLSSELVKGVTFYYRGEEVDLNE